MLEKLEDCFIVAELLEDFDISDYYDRTWEKKELSRISELLDYIEETENIRLPLIPLLYLYRLYTVDMFDCMDCEFMPEHTNHFIETLKLRLNSM